MDGLFQADAGLHGRGQNRRYCGCCQGNQHSRGYPNGHTQWNFIPFNLFQSKPAASARVGFEVCVNVLRRMSGKIDDGFVAGFAKPSAGSRQHLVPVCGALEAVVGKYCIGYHIENMILWEGYSLLGEVYGCWFKSKKRIFIGASSKMHLQSILALLGKEFYLKF